MSNKGKRKQSEPISTENETYPILNYDESKQDFRYKTQTQILIKNKTSSQTIKCDNNDNPFALIKLTDKQSKTTDIFMFASSFQCQSDLLSKVKTSFTQMLNRLNHSSSVFVAGNELRAKILSCRDFENSNQSSNSIMLIKLTEDFFKLLTMIHLVQNIRTRQKTEKLDLTSNTISCIIKKKFFNKKRTSFFHLIKLDNDDEFILCSELIKCLGLDTSLFHYQLKKFSSLKLYDGRLIFYHIKQLGIIHPNTPSITMMRLSDEPVQLFLTQKSIHFCPDFQEIIYDITTHQSDEINKSDNSNECSTTEDSSEHLTIEPTDDILSDVFDSDEEEEISPPNEQTNKRFKPDLTSLFSNIPTCSHDGCQDICNYQITFVDGKDLLFCDEHFPSISKLNYNLQIKTKSFNLRNLCE